MGGCSQSNVIDLTAEESRILRLIKTDFPSKRIYLINLFKTEKEQFPDMEEWEGDRYSGIGIKRMKAYKCNLPIDELNKLRDKFWNTKNAPTNSNSIVWHTINQAVVYDEYRANMLLEDNKITTYDGCINHLVDIYGNHYIIPNYCINEPYFEKEYKTIENIEKKEFNIILFDVQTNTNHKVKINNLMNGKELKDLFCEINNISFDNYKIRMFFSGNEITDEHFLYQYNIQNNFKIQVMKKEIEKVEENM